VKAIRHSHCDSKEALKLLVSYPSSYSDMPPEERHAHAMQYTLYDVSLSLPLSQSQTPQAPIHMNQKEISYTNIIKDPYSPSSS
jgi:hypothetical protein